MEVYLEKIIKYEKPLPRYTSYPTVPFWKTEEFDRQSALRVLQNQHHISREISLYIHLPYCERLCTFCGCNRRITKNHAVEQPYIDALLKEWKLYQQFLTDTPIVTHIHLGGGTPTFFAPEELERLIRGLLANARLSNNYEFSIEVHPNTCTSAHIDVLAELGFRRISVGIQDFDPKVQFIINRHQSFEKTQEVIALAREKGFTGINVDLVYGLPLQTLDSIHMTMEKVTILKPDRIAYYAYAHVPWKSKAQRRFTEADLPPSDEKINMFLTARKYLLESGYQQIAMDHFALPEDPMTIAWHSESLHRNFMGYTTDSTPLLIGLGASSISDFNGAYAQNHKEVEKYLEVLSTGILPIERGHLLSSTDCTLGKSIQEVMCKGRIQTWPTHVSPAHRMYIENQLVAFTDAGLLTCEDNSYKVTELGNLLLRNIASVFDAYLFEKGVVENMFSKSV